MANAFTIGMMLSAVDHASGVFNRMTNNAITDFGRMQAKLQQVSENMVRLGRQSTAAGLMMLGPVQKTISVFADLEEAQTRLKTTMMDTSGKTGKDLEEMYRLADRLGTALPGSTKDMVEMFIALREQGVQTKYILGGVGEAAAKFAVLMKLPFAEAATHVAKFQESMGVADKEAVSFMDTLQRLKFASGVEIGDLAYSFKYMGSSLKSLNIQGLEDAKKISAVIGVMASNSIEGSTAGTNFANALSKMALLTSKMDRKAIHKLVAPILDPKGIKLNFFTDKGAFVGIEGMIKELEKLKALNPQEKLIVLEKLFSVEAARPLSLLVDKGLTGYNEMLKRMQQQADMQKKIDAIMGTTKMRWDTLTGTVQNAVASIGAVTSQSLRLGSVFERLNNLFGRIDIWVKNHQRLAGAIGVTVAVTGGVLTVFGGGLLLLGMATKLLSNGIGSVRMFTNYIKIAIPWIRLKRAEIWRLIGMQKLMNYIQYHGGFYKAMQYWLMTTRYRMLENIGAMRTWIATMARTSFSGLLSGLRAAAIGIRVFSITAISGIRAMSIALVTTPIGWIILGITALIASGYLLWKHWDKVGKGISVAWLWMKGNWQKVLSVFLWVNPITAPIMALNKLLKFITGMNLFDAGKKVIQTLHEGMMSMVNKPVEAVKNITQKIRNFLPFSPAREGPFKDLHKIRIIETIAETMKPAPAITAMSKVINATRQVLQPITQPVRQMLEPVKAMAQPTWIPAFAGMTGKGAMPERTAAARSIPPINITQHLTFGGNVDRTVVKEVALQTASATEDAIKRVIEQYFKREGRIGW
ncbi:MAG: phage tail tape measure protein [Nitrospinae bacterium]|nr:phage tail tape measure protein [Nitrospinota bacterium]